MDSKIQTIFQSALQSAEHWRAMTAHITNPWDLGGRIWLVLYEEVEKFLKATGSVPSKAGLLLAVQERLRKAWEMGAPELEQYEWEYLCGVVNNPPEALLTTLEVSHWTGQHILALTHRELANTVSDIDAGDLGAKLKEYTEVIQRATAPSQIGDDDLNPFSKGNIAERQKVINFQPLSIPWLDKYIGGFAGREMYSYIGPTGGGKSTVAVQIACAYAKILTERQRVTQGRSKMGKVFYVTTEDGADKILNRMVCNLGKVSLDKISGKSTDPKTTNAAPSRRDVTICDKYFNGTVFGEQEREQIAQRYIAQNLRIIDLAQSKFRCVAADIIDCIPIIIQRALDNDRQRGINSYCALVVVDHAADLIFDQMQCGKELWVATQTTPYRIRDNICFKFECPVWVVHQASGKGNKKKVGELLDHTDGMGSASWGMHFMSCFNVSALDEESMTCMLSCSKARENKKIGPTWLKLEGDIGQMVEIDEPEKKPGQKKEKDSTKKERTILSRKKT